MQEIWRDIEGYEGLYQISNLGRVKSFAGKLQGRRLTKEKIMRFGVTKKGYLLITLKGSTQKETLRVHRLVAIHFIGKSNKPYVCHKGNNPSNNRCDNLYWGTERENTQQSIREGRFKFLSDPKPVYSIDRQGKINIYKSQTEASRKTGLLHDCISACCVGEIKTSGGLKWYFLNEKEVK